MAGKREPGRPKKSADDKRAAIARVASQQFGELGYEKTTIRSVASAASVDPKLVTHYFGNKESLFVESIGAPMTIQRALVALKASPKALRGRILAEAIFSAQANGEDSQLVGMIRAASTEPKAAELMREMYLKNVMFIVVETLGLEKTELRAVMLTSVLSGFVFTSRIVKIHDLAGASDAQRKKFLAHLINEVFTVRL